MCSNCPRYRRTATTVVAGRSRRTEAARQVGLAAPDMLGRVAPSTSDSSRGNPVDAERAPCLTRRLCDARHGTHRAERLFRARLARIARRPLGTGAVLQVTKDPRCTQPTSVTMASGDSGRAKRNP